MCGISGICSNKKNVNIKQFLSVHESLNHRGPDDSGKWFSEDFRVALGHNRLAIIDLSKAGHQPMISEDGQIVLVFNGEIYNYREIRNELEAEGESFRSQSDTEVILKLWQKEGRNSLNKFRGMFAFAIWNNLTKQLVLVRDSLGIKPLYFWNDGKTIAFASEIKALKAGGCAGELNPKAIGAFLQWGSIPPPLTLYSGVKSLLPGEVIFWDQHSNNIQSYRYWDYAACCADQESRQKFGRQEEAVQYIKEILLESVRIHLVSDVPVGAFLSGGIDSTAVVSLMRQAGQNHIATFSITFPDSPLDESRFSQLAAHTYQTEHHEWQVGLNEFISLKNEFLNDMDQPTIDGMNTWMVSKFARQHGYKVVTSGVGGDEFFAGYPGTFRNLTKLLNISKHIPNFIRQLSADFLSVAAPFIPNANRLMKLAYLFRVTSLKEGYNLYRGLFTPNEIRVLFADRDFGEQVASINLCELLPEIDNIPDDVHRVSVLEANRYMGSQLLPDSDVFSMAHALELRVPLVDKILAENLSQINPEFYYDDKSTPKSLLVKSTGDIPDEIVYRKKQGFVLPMDKWIKQKNWEPVSRLLNKKKCMETDAAFRNNKIHWSKRWGLEILDLFLGR